MPSGATHEVSNNACPSRGEGDQRERHDDAHLRTSNPMHLLKSGLMKVQWRKGPGQLLLTETSLFAFLSTADATRFGGAIAGLLGALIGYLIDSRNARLYSPLHMDD